MDIPESFLCPISHQLMVDPVITNMGISYEKSQILKWLESHNTCPSTNQPLTIDMLSPNRALQDSIEQLTKILGSQVKKTKISNEERLLKITSKYNGNELLVSINPPNGVNRDPAEICIIIDTSGSMGTNVSIKDDNGSSETYNIDILDLVKHATKTIINVMEPYDYLSVVAYSSSADVILDKCQMTIQGKEKAISLIDSLSPNGQTNLWDGLHKGLECISDVENKNTTIFLLTDGQPNIIPPRGHIPMLSRYIDEHKSMRCNINTFAFGYSADSSLMVDIAKEGNGSFNFIPDSGFVGTIFVHSLANFLTTKFNSVKLQIELDGSIDKSQIDIPFKMNRTSWGLDIDLGSVRYGQSKDIIIPVNLTPEQLSSINFSLSYRDANKPELYQVECSSIQEVSDDILIKRNYFRQKLVSLIYEILPSLSKSVLREDTLATASSKVQSLIEILSSESDEYIVNLKTDLEGQVLEALDSIIAFNKWGKDYLPSLLQAHELQQCNNFKDPGVQSYGGQLFNTIRDKADSVFCDLPPPQPASYKGSYGMSSRGSMPATMSVFNNSSGPCFDGNCDVLMINNSFKKVKDIRKNDIVKTPKGSAKVICVTKTICTNSTSQMVTINEEESGLIITPYHPIRISNIWKFPIDCGEMNNHHCPAIYNFVLDNTHIMSINGIECCTLGHNFQDNNVIRHSYYGTNAVINDLKKSKTWEYGIVMIYPDNIKRDDSTHMVNKIFVN